MKLALRIVLLVLLSPILVPFAVAFGIAWILIASIAIAADVLIFALAGSWDDTCIEEWINFTKDLFRKEI